MLLDSQKKLTGKEEIFFREKSTFSVAGNTRAGVGGWYTSGKLFGKIEDDA